VDVYVPGCPPRPDAIIEGIARAVQILAERGRQPVVVESSGTEKAFVPQEQPQ